MAVEPKIEVIPIKNGRFPDIKYVSYKLIFDKSFDKFKEIMELHGATKSGNNWIIEIK